MFDCKQTQHLPAIWTALGNILELEHDVTWCCQLLQQQGSSSVALSVALPLQAQALTADLEPHIGMLGFEKSCRWPGINVLEGERVGQKARADAQVGARDF
jgi:hypothetical protein